MKNEPKKYTIYFEDAFGNSREEIILTFSDREAWDIAVEKTRKSFNETEAFQLRNEFNRVIDFNK